MRSLICVVFVIFWKIWTFVQHQRGWVTGFFIKKLKLSLNLELVSSSIVRWVIFLPNQSRNQSLKYKARIKDQPIYQLLSLINLETSHLPQCGSKQMMLARIVQLIIVRITKITEISRADIILTFHYTSPPTQSYYCTETQKILGKVKYWQGQLCTH